MQRCRLSVILVLAMSGGMSAPPEADLPDEDGRVTIEGKTYEIYPPEKLRQAGLDVPEIPPEENAAWVYLRAINRMVPAPEDLADALKAAVEGTWPQGEPGERLASYLDQNQTALDLARQASEMPDYYLPFFRGDTDALLNALLPSLGANRRLAKLLAARAAYRASAGDAAAAIDDCLAAQRMAMHVGHGQTIIEGLVGLAISATADRSLRRLASSGVADPESLRAAVAEMERLEDGLPTFEEMVRAEDRWLSRTVDDLMEVPGTFGAITSGFSGAPAARREPNGWSRLWAALNRVYYPERAIKRHFKQYYETLIRASRPKEDGSVGEIIEEDALLARIPAWDVVSRMLMPSLAHVYEVTLRGRSNFVRTRVLLAIEAYKADQGALPPSLHALVPAYLSDLPVDPMTGYEFDYQPSPDVETTVKGLALVTRQNAEALRKKRRTPAILNPRASRWRRYTRRYVERFRFTASQVASAEAILRDIEARAAAFERTQGAKIQDLIDAGRNEAAARRMGPLNRLFEELKRRLDTLPTTKQRAAVEKPTEPERR